MVFTASTNEKVNSYISGLEEPHQSLVIRIREVAHAAVPNLKEDIKWRNCLVFTTQKNLTQLVVGKQHQTLIFFDGISLNDPQGVLEGDGNKTRNMKFTGLDFDADQLSDFLKQAAALQA